nr:mannitol-1-phosphate 5-dehydrogenase [Paenibacillus turpanensis]
MKAVHFGAGNIGRGFIGQLLSLSGYEICFVARNKKQIQLLQKKRQYTVKLASEKGETMLVNNITAVHVDDREEVMKRIAESDVVTTAVGAAALSDIAEVIAGGVALRVQIGNGPLHVIACENVMGGSSLLKEWVYRFLSPEQQEKADASVAFPNAIVDRIVPVQAFEEDPLAVKVEPFYEWVIHRSAIKEGFPGIKGVQYADALEPFMERKLFTVNTGHCCAAYFGYLEGHQTIQEAMTNDDVKRKVRQVLQETGKVLVRKHRFDEAEQQTYIEKTLERFANPRLTDRIVRVARSPIRKLSYHDRLVRPALQADRFGLESSHLAAAMAAALLFDYSEDAEAVKLQSEIRKKGIHHTIGNCTGIKEYHPMYWQIASNYERLKQTYRGTRETASASGEKSEASI